ncbi:cytochrome c, partial [bacterium]|nr:cytochrome c [bacterium]
AKVKAQKMPLTPVEGTVAWGQGPITKDNQSRPEFLKEDSAYYFGTTESGEMVSKAPIRVDHDVMKRGQERYNIYCAACHNRVGTGQSPVISRGFVPPPDLADPRLVAERDGYIFGVITNGIRNMPSYKKQIPESDRWAIVVYVRALQKARTATVADVPQDRRNNLK